ncbi:hypothetical protein A1507_06315 [Methylomonas koyamae]|uniref:Uncharacterized protein n=1 Tax=Methylomonas koyamae TaxID=702114 RepID=A0A177NR25_9GAMM|nr:hypothetical protein A1507_06315 [Methylomonas koyamae]
MSGCDALDYPANDQNWNESESRRRTEFQCAMALRYTKRSKDATRSIRGGDLRVEQSTEICRSSYWDY